MGDLDTIATEFAAFVDRYQLAPVSIPGTELQTIGPTNGPICITVTEAFIPARPETDFDHFLFISIEVEVGKCLAFFVGPQRIRNHMSVTNGGHLVSGITIAESDVIPKCISLVVFEIRRTRNSSRLINELEKLISALDYKNDYSKSILLAQTIFRELKVLAQFKDVHALMGGTHWVDALAQNNLYLVFPGEELKKDDERKLWIKEEQVFIGRSPGSAIPWRYKAYLTLSIGSSYKKTSVMRSIFDLRRQYSLTAGALGKEADKSIVRKKLEEEEILRKKREFTYHYGKKNVSRFPVVKAIVLEVSDDLVEILTSANNQITTEFQELIDMMRDGLLYELGHRRLPGLHIRGGLHIPGSYLIQLHEIPIVAGNITPEKVLCNASVEQLLPLNVMAQEATNPANGNKASWITSTDKDTVEKAGFTSWDAAGYMIIHLSAVIRKNFSEFVNIQTVAELIREWANDAFDSINQATGGLARFMNVLKAFAEEEVPIRSVREICTEYLRLTEEKVPAYEIYEELRCLDVIRKDLIGNRYNSDTCNVYHVSSEIVNIIKERIITNGDGEILALEPELTQEILAAVRNEVSALPAGTANPVVMVENWRIRMQFRKLVELEFPHLATMARREIDKPLQSIGTISLD